VQPGACRESGVSARGCVSLALCVAIVAAPACANAADTARLCDWLSGIADAAQAQANGEFARAEGAARRALAARPRGAAAARAQAAMGLALLAQQTPGEAAESLETALGSAVPARAHLAFFRGEALLAAGDGPRSARLFADAAQGRDLALATPARLREAQALIAGGLAADAAATL
jgi:soluble lytic murein transglycosylase